MATPGRRHAGDNAARDYPARQPSRWRRNLLLLAVALATAALAWAWNGLREQALVASAFAARTGCVCRFVSERPLESCEGDLRVAGLGRMAALVSLTEDAAGRGVKASVPLLAGQTATFAGETGCQLEPWRD